MFQKLWERICSSFQLVPANWQFADGDEHDGAYVHSTSVLGLSFSPDDSLLALAGGGCLPGADGSVRIIDVATRGNTRTLFSHSHGIHDVSFDPSTGILASASFDYSVNLWNLLSEDVIFLRGEDAKTKGFSKFTASGSLLAIGEYAYYDPPHSVYLYDLSKQKNVLEMALPNGLGVSSLAHSSDSKIMAFTASGHQNSNPAWLYVLCLDSHEIQLQINLGKICFYDLGFVDDSYRLIGGVSGGPFDEFESGLVEINVDSGEIRSSECLGGIGVKIACRPNSTEVAVGFGGSHIRFYDAKDWKVIDEYRFKPDDEVAGVSCLSYSNSGQLLAFGLSNGRFDIIGR